MENSEKQFCPYCEAEVLASAKKCKFCGEWLNKTDGDFPEELKHFNWGAFLLNWIWGIFHGKYITLLYFVSCLIPVIGPLAISIWFGFEGNKWAWQSRTWQNLEDFNRSQQNWVKLWFVMFILTVIVVLKVVILLALVGGTEV